MPPTTAATCHARHHGLCPPLHTVLTLIIHPCPAWQIGHERVYSPCVSTHVSTYVPPRVAKNFCKRLFSKQKIFCSGASMARVRLESFLLREPHAPTESLLARLGLPPAPLARASSPSSAGLRQSSAYPRPADGQEQEHTSQRGVDTYARAQCAAPAAPTPTASLHGRGEERLGIEEQGAVAIVLRQRINVREVAVHEGYHPLPRIVGMFQPEHMPQFVEQDPLDIDSRPETQCLFT